MAKPIIPLKPDFGTYDLTADEMRGLAWYVISGCSREEAFLKFIRPDFVGSTAKTALKNAISQFYGSKEVVSFVEAYRETLDKTLNVKTASRRTSSADTEARRLSAKTKLMDFAMSLADDIESADDPEFVLKIADKVGLLDGTDIQEQPRRYLPETCSQCRYRLFCEEKCEDECVYCKYKSFAEEHGLELTPETQLDLPK